MLKAVQKEQPDEVIHLGDCMGDTASLKKRFPDLPVTQVPGNCDGYTSLEYTKTLERDGVRILLGHGHQWNVKWDLDKALLTAQCAQANVLLFGHTHTALCKKEGNLWVLNPGTIGGIGAFPRYGLVTIENHTVICAVKQI